MPQPAYLQLYSGVKFNMYLCSFCKMKWKCLLRSPNIGEVRTLKALYYPIIKMVSQPTDALCVSACTKQAGAVTKPWHDFPVNHFLVRKTQTSLSHHVVLRGHAVYIGILGQAPPLSRGLSPKPVLAAPRRSSAEPSPDLRV